MTKYCPACESEYQDTLTNCPDDGEALFDAPSARIERGLCVDIYAAANEIEAKLILGILEGVGIPAQLFKAQISQFPSLGDAHFIVGVTPQDKAHSLQVISEARADGILSDSGIIL